MTLTDENGVEWDDPDAAPELAPDVAEFLDQVEPEREDLIAGCIEVGDRVIVTAGEGAGKSTLLRQIGAQAASGIHPFTSEAMRPINVLLVDLENSRRHLRRKLRPLALRAGAALEQGRMRVVSRPEGIDLLNLEDASWLYDLVEVNVPDLLITGPIYKMAGGDPTSEEVARKVARRLDQIRIDLSCALLLEAHTPYASNGGRRPMRPYGASLWSRWPEFGIHLGDTGIITHWRGAREDDHTWPAALKRGGEWPWTVENNARSVTFAQVLDATRDAGKRLSLRELEGITGGHRNTIDRAIKANQHQYDDLIRSLDGD